MKRVTIKYLVEDVDRHGNLRRYIRIPGSQKVRVRAKPGSPEFWKEYIAATGRPPEISQHRDASRYIYVITMSGSPVKIGIAADVARRHRGLQSAHPNRLLLYRWFEVANMEAAVQLETASHAALSSVRLNGEWFDCSPKEAVRVIKNTARYHGIELQEALPCHMPEAKKRSHRRPVSHRAKKWDTGQAISCNSQ